MTLENSAAYIKSWIEKLKNDPKLVVLAASSAQKAADYILDEKPSQHEQSTEPKAAGGSSLVAAEMARQAYRAR